uniref:Kinase n=1 Tax=Babesia bovis TaxID=5865 RepID=S6B6L5_BABBO|nr:hypothetical protein [Babesia bovis]
MTEHCQKSNRQPLQPFQHSQKKLSGTSLMLFDMEQRFVYKIIPEYNQSEAVFYSLVNGKPLNHDSMNYRYLKDSIRYPEELCRHNILPNYYGVVNVKAECITPEPSTDKISQDSNYFEIEEDTGSSNDVFGAIKLENLLHGYRRPAIIDVKLGIHNALDNAQYNGITAEERIACVKLWQNLKMSYKAENSGIKRLYNITAKDLGLGEPFTRMHPTELHSLLKSWRQHIVASQTTENELGFRICSISIDTDKGPLEITATQAKQLKKEETVSILQEVLHKVDNVRKCVVNALVKIKEWVMLQDMLSFAATSLLITYDQNNPALCKVRWVDFTHVESVKHSPYPVLPNPSNMVKGIDHLLSICENATK